MTELPEIYHSIEVYLFDNKLYVIPQAALPPILLWGSVEPVIEVADYESKTLAHAIESAKEMSKSRFDPAHADPNIKPLSGRKKEVRRIWNQSSKQWSLWWTEDGNINFETLVPDKMYRGGMQWRIFSKKTFHQDVSLEDVAKEILSQRVTTPNKEDLPDISILVNSFGYKMSWLAIKNATPEAIIQNLELPDVQVVDWDNGINKVYEYHGRPNNTIFLTPNIRGWVFVVGMYVCDLNKPDGKLEWLKERMMELSKVFGEVQAFATHRVSEYHHWILVRDGKVIRCFAFEGGGNGVTHNEGKPTEEEKMFDWDHLADYKHGKPWYPDEDDVMNLAGKWSINPETITSSDIKDKTCYITNIPY